MFIFGFVKLVITSDKIVNLTKTFPVNSIDGVSHYLIYTMIELIYIKELMLIKAKTASKI